MCVYMPHSAGKPHLLLAAGACLFLEEVRAALITYEALQPCRLAIGFQGGLQVADET